LIKNYKSMFTEVIKEQEPDNVIVNRYLNIIREELTNMNNLSFDTHSLETSQALVRFYFQEIINVINKKRERSSLEKKDNPMLVSDFTQTANTYLESLDKLLDSNKIDFSSILQICTNAIGDL
jgi:hypothetical protein